MDARGIEVRRSVRMGAVRAGISAAREMYVRAVCAATVLAAARTLKGVCANMLGGWVVVRCAE